MNELLVSVFVFLHFIGLALLLGALASQWGQMSRQVGPMMITGAVTQLVTGLVLMTLLISEINHVKVSVKLGLLVVILIVILLRRGKVFAPPFYLTAIGLTVVNVGLAVFW